MYKNDSLISNKSSNLTKVDVCPIIIKTNKLNVHDDNFELTAKFDFDKDLRNFTLVNLKDRKTYTSEGMMDDEFKDPHINVNNIKEFLRLCIEKGKLERNSDMEYVLILSFKKEHSNNKAQTNIFG